MTTRDQAASRIGSGRYRKGVSGNPRGRAARADNAHAPLVGMMSHVDGWLNAITGLGIATRDKSIATSFEVDAVDAESALQLWRGDPIAARIVEGPPNEATREGYELCIGDEEMPEPFTPPEQAPAVAQPGQSAAPIKPAPRAPIGTKTDRARLDAWHAYSKKHPSAFARRTTVAIKQAHRRMDATDAKPLQEAITRKLEQLQADAMIKEAMNYERAYGGGALLIGANDFTTDMRVPLDLKKVRSLDYLTPLEGRELIPLYYYNDPHAPKFGQVAIFQLVPYIIGAAVDPSRTAPRVTQIHESRLVLFGGARVSRRLAVSSGTWGWGDSVFTRVVRALRGYNVGYQNAEVMLHDFAQAVYKIKGLADLVSKNPNALTDSMINVELGRSICRAVVIDSEEEFERKTTTLTGYAELLDRFAQNLAAAADMPLTLLMGTSPAGLNATGASDIRFYYDRIATLQGHRVGPAIMRIVEVALAAMGEDPDKINHSVRFKALWQPTEKEVAEAHYIQAQADAIYLDRDVVSPEEIALSRYGGEQYSYETHIDFETRAAQQAIVAPVVNAKPTPPPVTGFDTPMPEGVKLPEQTVRPEPADETT